MEKIGTVKKISGEFIQVSIIRDSACGESCATCGLCSNSREMTVALKNTQGFEVGDKIRLISDDKKIVKFSATGYLSLTTLLILGAVIGGALGGDWAAFLGAVLGTVLGIAALKRFFTKKVDITTEKIEE